MDLNHRPVAYKTTALTPELCALIAVIIYNIITAKAIIKRSSLYFSLCLYGLQIVLINDRVKCFLFKNFFFKKRIGNFFK